MPGGRKKKRVPGSERSRPRGVETSRQVDLTPLVDVTVLVRRRPDAEDREPVPGERLSREEFAARRGADPADIQKIEEFARERKLEVLETDLEGRRVHLRGKVGDFSKAFSSRLRAGRVDGRTIRIRTGSVWVPEELDGVVVGVVGLDERKAGYRCAAKSRALRSARSQPATGNGGGPSRMFEPPEVGRLYGFPPELDGSGQCIAIIALNGQDGDGQPTGGYNADVLKAYFTGIGIQPIPRVESVFVDGGGNRPGLDADIDKEVMMDIEVAGALAPGARLAVYFAPNTWSGFLNVVKKAVHDRDRNPSVISISWVSPENDWSATTRREFDKTLQDATVLGKTICCASGNFGSSGHRGRAERKPEVNFPASSPFALACGGTRLLDASGQIASEVTWKSAREASGGGVSEVFGQPDYQKQAGVPQSPAGTPGRGVPDVAAVADSRTGYRIILTNGNEDPGGGTSVAAPLWAALIARINQGLAKQGKPTAGWIHPVIYSSETNQGVFRDITYGDNDIAGIGTSGKKYSAQRGWDPCTGLGSPDGARLARALGV